MVALNISQRRAEQPRFVETSRSLDAAVVIRDVLLRQPAAT
jgi:hypothetical protein